MYDLDDEKLDERKERAIFLLMEGKTVSNVAVELGVDRSTTCGQIAIALLGTIWTIYLIAKRD